MDKKNEKGLADMQEGDFILNESNTAVTVEKVEGVDDKVEEQGFTGKEDAGKKDEHRAD